MSVQRCILSIDCSIAGGSLALFGGKHLLDDRLTSKTKTQSEDVLYEIEKLLIKNGIKNKEIEKVVISKGPGSLTGIRIGMAIGFGLRKTIGCNLIGISALEGLLALVQNQSRKLRVITAIPIGKTQICSQLFEINQKNEILERFEHAVESFDKFSDGLEEQVSSLAVDKVILHNKLYEELKGLPSNTKAAHLDKFELVDAGENISKLNGLKILHSLDQYSRSNLEILYASNQNFLK